MKLTIMFLINKIKNRKFDIKLGVVSGTFP